jgi:hypothetical protein
MKIPQINLNKEQFFSLGGLFWVGFGWLALLLSLAGFFCASFLTGYLILGILAGLYLILFNKSNLHPSKHFLFIFVLAFLMIALWAYFSTPTIFSGRDQGTLSGAAVELVNNHQFSFSFPAVKEFFSLYGPGKALNFPGFNYTETGGLIPHFPLGFIAWLGAFYALFGLKGFVLANGVTFLIFVLSFYLLAKRYFKFGSNPIHPFGIS